VHTNACPRFFNQPRKDALIQGPKKKYPMVTGGEFTKNAMKLYYAALQERQSAEASMSHESIAGGESSITVATTA
jgi:hypothetical protein